MTTINKRDISGGGDQAARKSRLAWFLILARRLCRRVAALAYWSAILILISSSYCASFRTSFDNFENVSSSKQYIAVDFMTPIGEHITAPIGKGKSIAPNIIWKNAKVVDIFWPEAEKLDNSDGSESDYSGYSRNFTVIYSLEIVDVKTPIEYDLFYVSCGNSCRPMQQKGIIKPNGLLPLDEIEKVDRLSKKSDVSLIITALLGFVGGIILNFMPCVFPIVSIKLFSIIKSSKENITAIKRNAISFALGNIFSFITIGSILALLRRTIPDLGWGFYMQEPKFVVVLLIAFLMCGLHFFGLYNFKIPIKRISFPIKKTYLGSFCNGAFGAFASASCVGPFVGIAVASAVLYLDFLGALAIFTSIGIGVSVPFLLISLFPSIIKIFPVPGKWLETFKEFMGFTMLLSCVWLLWILTSQINISSVMLIIAILIIISFFIWSFKKSNKSKISRAVSLFGFLFSCIFSIYSANNFQKDLEKVTWKDYSPNALEEATSSGKPVFISFTAAWCINCQFNSRVFLDKEIINLFKAKNIQAIQCDWTNRSKDISDLLKSYGSASIPFYVYYPAGSRKPIKFPSIITKNKIIKTIEFGDQK